MYLDISNLFLFCLISLVVGAVIMLIVQVRLAQLSITLINFRFPFQYYIFLRFFKLNSDEVEAKSQEQTGNVKSSSKFSLPEVSIRKQLLYSF